MRYRRRRNIPGINSSTSADIAFLLLSFFLITTTLSPSGSISRKLPPVQAREAASSLQQNINQRNLLTIGIEPEGKITCNSEPTSLEQLKIQAKNFIDNPENKADLSELSSMEVAGFGQAKSSPNHVISLQIDDEADYKTYIAVQNILILVYSELRNDAALLIFRKPLASLTEEERGIILQLYPLHLFETKTSQNKRKENSL